MKFLYLGLFTASIIVPATTGKGQENDKSAEGSIKGKITITANDDVGEDVLRDRMLNRYAMREHRHGEEIQPYRLSEKAVVYIDDIEEGDTVDQSPAVRPQLNQSQMMFRPLVLPIVVGTAVDFPNNDNLYHNVFSYSQPREFDLGRYPTGQKRAVLFEKPGVVKVYCDIHSHMYATILVLKSHYFALPDDDGNFEISNIPEGSHKLVFWYGRKEVASRKVVVKQKSVLNIDFSY